MLRVLTGLNWDVFLFLLIGQGVISFVPYFCASFKIPAKMVKIQTFLTIFKNICQAKNRELCIHSLFVVVLDWLIKYH